MRVFLLLILSSVLAAPWTPSLARENTLSASVWRDGVRVALKRFACEERSAFLTCYETTAERCNAKMAAGLEECFEEHAADIPEQVQSDGPVTAKLIECSQRKYVDQMRAHFSSSCGEESDYSDAVYGRVPVDPAPESRKP